MKFRALTVAAALAFASSLALGASAQAATQSVIVGKPAPAMQFRTIDGKTISPAALRGHRYVLWIMATWCPSCTTGAAIVAQHMVELRARHVLILQMEAAGNLGYPGPSLASIQNSIGPAGRSPNWYWGELTQAQSLMLDPSSTPDIYYLVNKRGTVIEQGSAPGAHWDQIERFSEGR